MNLSDCILSFFVLYLLGSTPFGWIIVKFVKGEDIRKFGSGNIGATNVFRTYGWKLGWPTLILDTAKGLAILMVVPLLVSKPDNLVWISAGCGAILGHVFTFWFSFNGGKGVATAAGVLLALLSLELFVGLGIWIMIVLTTRYVFMGSISASLAILISHIVKISGWFKSLNIPFSDNELYMTLFCLVIVVLVVYTHRKNIRRFKNHEENKVDLDKIFRKFKKIFSAAT